MNEQLRRPRLRFLIWLPALALLLPATHVLAAGPSSTTDFPAGFEA
jgi:hypothetical protein